LWDPVSADSIMRFYHQSNLCHPALVGGVLRLPEW
jgi:hypothetical protein